MGSRAMLQGVPWHEEQLKRTCKNGSKYCVYNRNICACTYSRFYHKKCVGKGECDDFESRSGTPKVKKTYKSKQKKEKVESMENQVKNSKPYIMNEKHRKFIETAESRVNDIIVKIEKLENLSDKNRYEYTNEEINV